MAEQTHLGNFPVDVVLGGGSDRGVLLDFSKVLIIDTLANPLTGLTTEIIGTSSAYARISESAYRAGLPQVAGADTAEGLKSFFNMLSHPSEVQIISVDTGGSDTISSTATILPQSKEFTSAVVLPDDLTVLGEVVVSYASQMKPVFGALAGSFDLAATDQAAWDASAMGGLSDLENTWTSVGYHKDNGTSGVAFWEYAATLAARNWDEAARTSQCVLYTVPNQSADITPTGANHATQTSINSCLPLFSSSTYLSPGNSLDRTPIYSRLLRNLRGEPTTATAKFREDKTRPAPRSLSLTRGANEIVVRAGAPWMRRAESGDRDRLRP